MKKKIVLINQVVGYLFIDIANKCLDEFDEVVLLTGSIHPLTTELDPRIKIINICKYKKKSTFSRFYTWLIAFIQSIFWLKFRYRNSYVLISSNPPLATISSIFIKNKFSLVIYDIYPEAIVTSGFVSKNSSIYKIWEKLNKIAYRKADYIFTLTEGMVKILKPYTSKDNVILNPAWADNFGNSTIPRTENVFIKNNNLQDKFIILYSGNLGKEYEIETILDVAEQFVGNDKIQFVIAGKGWKKELLQTIIETKKLTNTLLIPYQDSVSFMHSMHAMNIGIVSQAINAAEVCIPSKTYNIMAFAKPIICIGNKNTDLGNLINKYDLGFISPSSEYSSITKFINEISQDELKYNKISDNVKLAASNFTRKNAAIMINTIVNK